MERKNHTIKCLNPDCIGGRIETTLYGDSGYSNWTVMDGGAIEFKCHGCGKFASTDEYKKPNNPENFEVSCDKCGGKKWSHDIQDVDGEAEETNIECEDCHAKTFEITNMETPEQKALKQFLHQEEKKNLKAHEIRHKLKNMKWWEFFTGSYKRTLDEYSEIVNSFRSIDEFRNQLKRERATRKAIWIQKVLAHSGMVESKNELEKIIKEAEDKFEKENE